MSDFEERLKMQVNQDALRAEYVKAAVLFGNKNKSILIREYESNQWLRQND